MLPTPLNRYKMIVQVKRSLKRNPSHLRPPKNKSKKQNKYLNQMSTIY